MEKYLMKIALLFLPSLVLAQLSVKSDLTYDYGKDADILGIDAVVLFEKMDASAMLVYDFVDSTQCEWHYHTSVTDSLISSSVKNDTVTSLDSLKQGLYELRLETSSYYFSVVDFSEYQGMVDSVWVDDSGDSCNTVKLFAHLVRQNIPVYDKVNDTTQLLQDATTEYLWSNDSQASNSPSKLDAPLEDIEYECIPFSDNFFTSNDFNVNYSNPDTAYAIPYTAIAIKLGALEAEIPEDDGKSNVSVKSSTSEGSAPLSVTYTVSPEGASEFTSWWLWNIDNTKPSAPTYRYQDQVTHTFLSFAENGYRVQVIVGNDYCQVTDSMDVMVTESSLKVPNVLFLGFGAEGKFKVAYQSLDPSTFKAAIYDRNGRLVYKWRDPSGGWDGRSPITGVYVSPGAYYYSIQAKGTDGIEYKEVGDVSVIREKGI